MMNVYYTCPFVPRELIAACGLSPCRQAPALDTDARPEGMCSFTSAWIESLQRNIALGERFAAVFSSSCDQMRRAFDVYSQSTGKNCFLLNVPSTNTERAFGFYLNELRRLQGYLCKLSGQPIDWNRVGQSPSNEPESAEPDGAMIKIAITGGPIAASLLEHVTLLICDGGGQIVLNTTESKLKPVLSATLQDGRNPLETLARAYFNIPAIWKRPNTAYFQWLGQRVQEHRADGVILLRQSFCDVWHSQGQEITKQMTQPVLKVDLDGKGTLSAGAVSRIEAFLEALA
jgi:benzoyl-CoA reductase/2-hydroxyglutaryl-CoA dehydratase subunit BcrC/BadD/HgdB